MGLFMNPIEYVVYEEVPEPVHKERQDKESKEKEVALKILELL